MDATEVTTCAHAWLDSEGLSSGSAHVQGQEKTGVPGEAERKLTLPLSFCFVQMFSGWDASPCNVEGGPFNSIHPFEGQSPPETPSTDTPRNTFRQLSGPPLAPSS